MNDKLNTIIRKYNSFIEKLEIPFFTFYNFTHQYKQSKKIEFSEPSRIIFRLRMEGIKDISEKSNKIEFKVPNLKGIIELQIMMWVKSGFIEINENDIVTYNISLRQNFINQWILVSLIFGLGGIYHFLFVQFFWIIRLLGIYFRHYIFLRKLLRFI